MRWVPPAVFLTYRGVKIYHIYRNDQEDQGVRAYWYCTDPLGGGDGYSEFNVDVRTLPGYSKGLESTGDGHIKRVLRDAIKAGILKKESPVAARYRS